MLILSSERFADHITPPGHPESPERNDVLETVAARLKTVGAEVVEPRPATREQVLRVHAAAHVDATHGQAQAHNFRVKNNTKGNVTISNLRVSCGCVTATAMKSRTCTGTRELENPGISMRQPPMRQKARNTSKTVSELMAVTRWCRAT